MWADAQRDVPNNNNNNNNNNTNIGDAPLLNAAKYG